jgi:hypothetical protein
MVQVWCKFHWCKTNRQRERHCDLRFFRADDGIRTRDPHLGKVANVVPPTCAEAAKVSVSRAFGSRRHSSIAHGFPFSDGRKTGSKARTTGTLARVWRPSQPGSGSICVLNPRGPHPSVRPD